jgi:hypothetical protein
MLTHVSDRLDQELANIEFNQHHRTYKVDDSDALRTEMDRLNILFQKGRITERYYDEQYEILEKKLSESETIKVPSPESYRDVIRAFSGNWQDLYLKLSSYTHLHLPPDKNHKQAFWKSTIKDIQIDKETHKICGFNFLSNLA